MGTPQDAPDANRSRARQSQGPILHEDWSSTASRPMKLRSSSSARFGRRACDRCRDLQHQLRGGARAAGIAQLFDARVDGRDITRLGSQGQAGARCVPGGGATHESSRRVRSSSRMPSPASRPVVPADSVRHRRRSRRAIAALREAGADVVVTTWRRFTSRRSRLPLVTRLRRIRPGARRHSRVTVRTGEWIFRDTRSCCLGRRGCGPLSGDLPRGRLQPAAHRYRRPSRRERGPGQSSQLAGAEFRIDDGEWFDLRAVNDPVISTGAGSSARRAICERSARRRPRPTHDAHGATLRFNELTCTWARSSWR